MSPPNQEPPVQQPKVLTNAEIRSLVDQLQKESSDERSAALQTLGTSTIPSDAIELADCLSTVLESDAVWQTRAQAAAILARTFASIPKYTHALFAALNDSSAEVRGHVAIHCISCAPREQKYVPEYLAALRHSDKNVRKSLIWQLHSGPFDIAITQEIIGALSDPESITRNQAVGTLASILGQPEQAVIVKPVLIAALKAPEDSIAYTAANALRNLESNAEADAVFHAAIEAKLRSGDENTRREALWELGGLPKDGVKYIDRIVELLDGTDSDLFNAALLLEKIGTPAQAAIPYLKRTLLTNNRNRVREIAKALAALGAHDPEIIDFLAHQCLSMYPHNVGAIYCAAEGLSHFGKDGVPSLIKGLDWDHGIVQSNCIDHLAKIGKDAIAAVPQLLQMLRDGGGQPMTMGTCGAPERSTLIDALVSIAPDDENVIGCLRAIAQDGNDGRHDYAARALKQIGVEVPEPTFQATSASDPVSKTPQGFCEAPPSPWGDDGRAMLEARAKAKVQEQAALLSGLTDADENVRRVAASTVSPDVVRAFLVNLGSSPGRVRDVALHSLECLDSNDMAPLLLKALPSGGIDDGPTLINKIGTDARKAVPALLRQVHEGHAMFKLSHDTEFGHRSDVLDALAKIAPDDDRVLECLARLAANERNNQNTFAQAAIAALSSIGSEQAMAIVEKHKHS